MSYNLVDRSGVMDQLATNSGLAAVYDWIENNGGPLARNFVRQGYTAFPKRLASSLYRGRKANPPVAKATDETLGRLVGLLRIAKGFAVVE